MTQKYGLNEYLQPLNAPITKPTGFVSAFSQDNNNEYTPYAQPYLISKGSLNTIAGGVLTLYDITGGTKILTYDPETGVVTILGSLQVQQSNSGTYSNITLAGTTQVTGTIQNGVFATPTLSGGTYTNAVINNPALSGGTLNPGLYQIGGTAGATGSIVYVKTVDFVGSTTTVGTVRFSSGVIYSAN